MSKEVLEEKEIIIDEEKEELENEESEEVGNSIVVANVNELSGKRKSTQRAFTTMDLTKVENQKKVFNLENHCDYKINDCKGQLIRVKDVLIKNIQSKLAEPEINEETGEVKEYKFSKICILIDDQGKSYVTASKLFTLQMTRYLEMFGTDAFEDGLEIKIIEKEIKNSSNKSLGFELI